MKLWISAFFYRLCRPYIDKEVASLVQWELWRHHRLTADVRAFIMDELQQLIPREGTTHDLLMRTRADLVDTKAVVGLLEKRLDAAFQCDRNGVIAHDRRS